MGSWSENELLKLEIAKLEMSVARGKAIAATNLLSELLVEYLAIFTAAMYITCGDSRTEVLTGVSVSGYVDVNSASVLINSGFALCCEVFLHVHLES